MKTNYPIHIHGANIPAGLPQFPPFELSISNIREAREGAQQILTIFDTYRQGAFRNPNNGTWWHMMSKVKRICVSMGNHAKANKQYDIASEYERVYKNQMNYPPKGANWRKYDLNYEF